MTDTDSNTTDETATIRYFDTRQHEAAQALKKAGILQSMGDRFGGLVVRLTPLNTSSVMVAGDAAEKRVRAQAGISPTAELTSSQAFQINRAKVLKAIMGIKGGILAEDEMLEIAKHRGFDVRQGGLVVLHDKEPAADVRDFIAPLVHSSQDFFVTLHRLAGAIGEVPDKELVDAGKDFVHGGGGAPGSDG